VCASVSRGGLPVQQASLQGRKESARIIFEKGVYGVVGRTLEGKFKLEARRIENRSEVERGVVRPESGPWGRRAWLEWSSLAIRDSGTRRARILHDGNAQ
jgi:hypothetical protein